MRKKIFTIVVGFLLAAGAGCSKTEPSSYQFAIDTVKAKPGFAQQYWAVKYDKTGQSADSVATQQLEMAVIEKIDRTTGKGYNGKHIPPGLVAVVVCWTNTKTKGESQISIFDLATKKEFETRSWGLKDCKL